MESISFETKILIGQINYHRMENDQFYSSSSPVPRKKTYKVLKLAAITSLILLTGLIGYELFLKKEPKPVSNKVFTNPDGSVTKVEEYIRKNMLTDPTFFEAVHWTPLRKSGELMGSVTYRVGVIFRKKNEKNEVVMDSKLLEIDENGNILFVLDSGPINNN